MELNKISGQVVDAALEVQHRSQLFTYLKLSGRPLGLLINFGQRHLKDGIHRIAD